MRFRVKWKQVRDKCFVEIFKAIKQKEHWDGYFKTQGLTRTSVYKEGILGEDLS